MCCGAVESLCGDSPQSNGILLQTTARMHHLQSFLIVLPQIIGERQCQKLFRSNPIIIFFLFIGQITFGANICTQKEMACHAQLHTYPLLESDDGSGWDGGSGMGNIPLYDEFFTPVQVFDFSQPSNATTEKICECPNDEGCMSNEENIIKLDEMITLVFCNRVDDIFRRRCRGVRSLIRVIGRIHESGEILTSVTETVLFCKCERGYQRVRIEPWFGDLYAFTYRCL